MISLNITIEAGLPYSDIPLPQKLVVPVPPGSVKLLKTFRYQQHPETPLSARELQIDYDVDGKLKIAMKLEGKLHFSPGGDVSFDDGRLVLSLRPQLTATTFAVDDVKVQTLALRRMPVLLEPIAKKVVNSVIVPRLQRQLTVDVAAAVVAFVRRFEAQSPFAVEAGLQQLMVAVQPNVQHMEPQLDVLPDQLHLVFSVASAPQLSISDAPAEPT